MKRQFSNAKLLATVLITNEKVITFEKFFLKHGNKIIDDLNIEVFFKHTENNVIHEIKNTEPIKLPLISFDNPLAKDKNRKTLIITGIPPATIPPTCNIIEMLVNSEVKGMFDFTLSFDFS